jgi:hypothetical protein
MKSKNQKFSNDHKKLLRILRVGMKCGGSIGQTSDFVPRNRFGKISARLWKYVNDTRERMRYFQKHNPKYIREIEQKCPDALALEHEAAMLPDPGADMAETKWWEMGKQFLIESYPHPKLPGQLNENVPVLDNLITARSHRRGRAAKLNRIEFEFERNFERFAKQCRKGTVITNTSG